MVVVTVTEDGNYELKGKCGRALRRLQPRSGWVTKLLGGA
jgi:hypothetical protein